MKSDWQKCCQLNLFCGIKKFHKVRFEISNRKPLIKNRDDKSRKRSRGFQKSVKNSLDDHLFVRWMCLYNRRNCRGYMESLRWELTQTDKEVACEILGKSRRYFRHQYGVISREAGGFGLIVNPEAVGKVLRADCWSVPTSNGDLKIGHKKRWSTDHTEGFVYKDHPRKYLGIVYKAFTWDEPWEQRKYLRILQSMCRRRGIALYSWGEYQALFNRK